jgi:tetratricopeptide (TPR) repeat protein
MRASMNLQTFDHEERILRDIKDGMPISFERALLVVSRLKTEEEIISYEHKIDDLWSCFLTKCNQKSLSDPSRLPSYLHRSVAKCLFEYLWMSKPRRFGEHFLLNEVVDAQLNADGHRTVGTCVGLTSLYSVLGLRAGLNLSLLVASDHLLNRLRVEHQTIDIDHTDPGGFGCGNGGGFHELPLLMLIANVLNSRGLRNERRGNFAAAKADYQKALRVNPEYANAYNNRGNMRFWSKDIRGAIADYTEAIRLDPSFCEAYCNRGMAQHKIGRYVEACRDYNAAISTNSEYDDAHKCLQSLSSIGHSTPREGTVG